MNIDLELVRAISAFGAAVGVAFAAIQLWRSKQQQVLRFEDEIAREYREIARKIPIEALLGKNLNDYSETLNSTYTYIDFCNEQIFLRKKGRIRKSTWDNWLEGIEANMKLPAFDEAWKEIHQNLPGIFTELKRLEDEDYKSDPKKW